MGVILEMFGNYWLVCYKCVTSRVSFLLRVHSIVVIGTSLAITAPIHTWDCFAARVFPVATFH